MHALSFMHKISDLLFLLRSSCSPSHIPQTGPKMPGSPCRCRYPNIFWVSMLSTSATDYQGPAACFPSAIPSLAISSTTLSLRPSHGLAQTLFLSVRQPGERLVCVLSPGFQFSPELVKNPRSLTSRIQPPPSTARLTVRQHPPAFLSRPYGRSHRCHQCNSYITLYLLLKNDYSTSTKQLRIMADLIRLTTTTHVVPTTNRLVLSVDAS